MEAEGGDEMRRAAYKGKARCEVTFAAQAPRFS